MPGSSPSPSGEQRVPTGVWASMVLLGASAIASGAWVGGPDPGRCLAFAALVAAPVGALQAGLGGRRGAAAEWVGLGTGLLGVAAFLLFAPRVPHPIGAAIALLGLFACGFGLASLVPRSSFATAGLLLLLGAAAAALPGLTGWAGRAPWPPTVAATLLTWAPTTLACEAAGLDWMRSPAIYDAVGTDAIGPDLRLAHGALAGVGPLVVGCALAIAGCALRRRHEPQK